MKKELRLRLYALLVDFLAGSFLLGIIGLSSKPKQLGSFDILGQHFTYGLALDSISLFLYFFIADLFFSGDTIGKSIYHLKVLKTDNSQLIITEKIWRSFIKMLLVAFFPVPIIYYAVKKENLLDKLTKTKTVTRKQPSLQ